MESIEFEEFFSIGDSFSYFSDNKQKKVKGFTTDGSSVNDLKEALNIMHTRIVLTEKINKRWRKENLT